MKDKKRLFIVFLSGLTIIVVAAIIGIVVWQQTQAGIDYITTTFSPASDDVDPTPTPSIMSMDGDVRLVITKIGVDAPVESVGLDDQGRMGVPVKNPFINVGWYKNGPRPGEKGSAVIDGHLDQPGGVPAVFWKLKELAVGDIVMLKHKNGHTLHFEVIRTQVYPVNDAPIKQIFGDNSGHYLNLITCAGDWIPSQEQPSHRLIVFTKLVI